MVHKGGRRLKSYKYCQRDLWMTPKAEFAGHMKEHSLKWVSYEFQNDQTKDQFFVVFFQFLS